MANKNNLLRGFLWEISKLKIRKGIWNSRPRLSCKIKSDAQGKTGKIRISPHFASFSG